MSLTLLGTLLLVSKKDESHSPVIDFWKVSALTVPDHYPTLFLSYLLQSLVDSKAVFSSIGLSGFWKISLDAKSREVTAFSTPSGQLHLPLGMRNALTFQRMVSALFAGVTENG